MSGLDIRSFTVGPVQENAYIVSAGALPHCGDGPAPRVVLVDPGDEPDRLLEALTSLGAELEAILITHCHFDHIGAVAPIARATGAPVYCPQIERPALEDIMRWVPPGFGPFDSYEPEHTVAGGERLSLAGLDINVLFTPGHSPGHVTYAIAPAQAQAPPTGASDRVLLSGDVLFAGSVGRVDLPGGDWPTLERSIAELLRAFSPDTVIYPGHMQVTTLGRERDSNPFLSELRVPVAADAPPAPAAIASDPAQAQS
jgi:hydroxyacylglutathione hydrolase